MHISLLTEGGMMEEDDIERVLKRVKIDCKGGPAK